MDQKVKHAFALSAAALFMAACNKGGDAPAATDAPGATAATKVKCLGVNECKGQAACDMPTHSCAGQNECRGKGWILVSEAECSEKGGTVKQ